MYLFSRTFWGIVLISIGILYFLRNYLNIDIPIGSLILPLIFIYWGLLILIRPHRRWSGNTEERVLFDEGSLTANSKHSHYDIVFGRGTVDLTSLNPKDIKQPVQVNVVFGSGLVLINPNIPTLISLSSAFGTGRSPQGQTTAFGTTEYRTKTYKEGEPHLYIKASAVFGELILSEKS